MLMNQGRTDDVTSNLEDGKKSRRRNEIDRKMTNFRRQVNLSCMGDETQLQ